MSLCCETYRRSASILLVLALVLIALPSLSNAQTAPQAPTARSADDVPKAEFYIGYQWWNPGGDIPDQNSPPRAFSLPSVAPGFGTSLTWNVSRGLGSMATMVGSGTAFPRRMPSWSGRG